MAAQDQNEELNPFWDKLGVLCGSLKELVAPIKLCFEVGLVPCLNGEAGIGKTDIFRQIAADLGYDIHFIFLAHSLAEDLRGIPFPDDTRTAYRYLIEEPMQRIIRSGKPTIVVFDEWNRGDKQVMNAAFTVMEHRRFGDEFLPDHIKVAAAMNPSEGNYLVNECEKDPAFRRRLVFFAVRPDAMAYLDWARNRGKLHPHVIGFNESAPHMLIDTASREAGKVYANPAGYEKISKILYRMESLGMPLRENMNAFRLVTAGILGVGVMENLTKYIEDKGSLINPEEVVSNYDRVRKKVQKLAKDGANDVLSELAEAVAIFIVSHESPVKKAAEAIASFSEDLPPETREKLRHFLAHKADQGQKMKYLIELSTELRNIGVHGKTVTDEQLRQKKLVAEIDDEKKKSKSK